MFNYELERLGGVTFGQNEFQQGLKMLIPNGWSFKGVPIHLKNITNAHEIWKQIITMDDIKDILNIK